MSDVREILQYLPGIRFEENFVFSRHTTIGMGGSAPLALYPKTEEELVCAVGVLRARQIPYFILGKGANIVVSDNGFAGVVLVTSGLKEIARKSDSVYAQCGATAEQLVRFAQEKALCGAEFLAGIPASVGGLVYMNAGAANVYVDSVIKNVTVLRDGNVRKIDISDCGFTYKKSVFQENEDVILGCTFRFRAGNVTEIAAKIRERRFARNKLPCGRSVGCVFKNPPGCAAGELIERAGWKGKTAGGLVVSAEHANFIINTGTGTAQDFLRLVAYIRQDVFAKTGIVMQEEFRYIGE